MRYYKEHITLEDIVNLVSSDETIKQIGAIIGIADADYHFNENMLNQFGTMVEALLHGKKKLEETENIDDTDRFLKLIIGPNVNIKDKSNEVIIQEWLNKIKQHNHKIIAVIG